MTRSEQPIIFTPEYSLSSSVQAFAETNARVLERRNPELGMMGLLSGDFQVITINGMKAIDDAVIDNINASFGPFVSQRITHNITMMAMRLSNPDHAHLPLKRRMIVVIEAPVP
ncbi:MAG: hypothetical protein WCS89_00810 [Candidatus Paceibacterota bacterium]